MNYYGWLQRHSDLHILSCYDMFQELQQLRKEQEESSKIQQENNTKQKAFKRGFEDNFKCFVGFSLDFLSFLRFCFICLKVVSSLVRTCS